MASRMKSKCPPSLFAFDAIGFDVDHTLCKYNIFNLYKLIYDGLSKYLVNERRYNHRIFYPTTESDWDFCFKGLILDIKKGNFLKLLDDGYICRASHGSKMLSDEDIVKAYGAMRKWPVLSYYLDVMNFNNRHLQQMGFRVFEDYFQVPAALASAKIVDFVDNVVGKSLSSYTFWPDVLDGLLYIYTELGFGTRTGVIGQGEEQEDNTVYPDLYRNPGRYLVKCEPGVLRLLEALRGRGKTLFLLSSAEEGFVDHALTYTMGEEWKKYFHLFVYSAHKPGFFTKRRAFHRLDNRKVDKLVLGGSYKVGNCGLLHSFLQSHLGTPRAKVCYVGDSLQSDVYPVRWATPWSALAVCPELWHGVEPGEPGEPGGPTTDHDHDPRWPPRGDHPHPAKVNGNCNNNNPPPPPPPPRHWHEAGGAAVTSSLRWGPYGREECGGGGGRATLWGHVIGECCSAAGAGHAPHLAYLATATATTTTPRS